MRAPSFRAFFLSLLLVGTTGFPRIAPAAVPKTALAADGSVLLTGGLPSGSDITAAAQAAVTRADADGRPLSLPWGTYFVSQPLTVREDLRGTGARSVLVGRGLPAGGALLTVRARPGSDVPPVVSGLSLLGPGRAVLGRRTAGCDGLRAETACRLDSVDAEQWDSGLVNASPVGHVFAHACKSSNNYYGLYNVVQSGDLRVGGSLLDGNSFASIAMTAEGGIHSAALTDTDLGHSPYGIYQEPGQPGRTVVCLSDVVITDCPFEACGNGAILSEVTGTPTGPRCEFRNIRMTRVGFTWGEPYRIVSRPRDYCVSGDLWWQTNTLDQGNYPFLSGDKAVFGFTQAFTGDDQNKTLIDNRPADGQAMQARPADAMQARPADAKPAAPPRP